MKTRTAVLLLFVLMTGVPMIVSMAQQRGVAAQEGPNVQGPIIVGQTRVTWTGAWQYDASSSILQQATLVQVDPASDQVKLATYGEFVDSTVTDPGVALDTFATTFFQGAGAQSVVRAGEGVLPSGTIWTIYTFELRAQQLTLLATARQSATSGWVVSTLTGNTETFQQTIELAQQEILLNSQPLFLDGVDATEVLAGPATEEIPQPTVPASAVAATPEVEATPPSNRGTSMPSEGPRLTRVVWGAAYVLETSGH